MAENEQYGLPPHLVHFLGDSSGSAEARKAFFAAYGALGEEEQALVHTAWRERDRKKEEARKDGVFKAFLGERSPEQALEDIRRDLRIFEEWLEREAEADLEARKEKGRGMARSAKVYGNVGLGMWLRSVDADVLSDRRGEPDSGDTEPCAALVKFGDKESKGSRELIAYEDVFSRYNAFLQRENRKWSEIFSEPLTRDAYIAKKSQWDKWAQMMPGESERYFNRREQHGDVFVSVLYQNPGGDMVYELWMDDKQDPSVSSFPLRFAWDKPGEVKGIRATAEAVAELAIEGAKAGKRGAVIMEEVRAMLKQRSGAEG